MGRLSFLILSLREEQAPLIMKIRLSEKGVVIMAVKQKGVLGTSNEFVDFLLEEFEEACGHTLQLLERLKKTDPQSQAHEALEGAFYGALVDLRDHARDLIRAWDKLTDSFPDEE